MKANNDAKLREALAQKSVEDADTAAWILDKSPEDVCEERMSWSELCDMAYNLADGFTTLRNAVKSALAEPVRNCDLYKTKEEAQEAFLKEACDHPCGNCWVEDINNECGVEWLLAHATEKEGVVK